MKKVIAELEKLNKQLTKVFMEFDKIMDHDGTSEDKKPIKIKKIKKKRKYTKKSKS